MRYSLNFVFDVVFVTLIILNVATSQTTQNKNLPTNKPSKNTKSANPTSNSTDDKRTTNNNGNKELTTTELSSDITTTYQNKSAERKTTEITSTKSWGSTIGATITPYKNVPNATASAAERKTTEKPSTKSWGSTIGATITPYKNVPNATASAAERKTTEKPSTKSWGSTIGATITSYKNVPNATASAAERKTTEKPSTKSWGSSIGATITPYKNVPNATASAAERKTTEITSTKSWGSTIDATITPYNNVPNATASAAEREKTEITSTKSWVGTTDTTTTFYSKVPIETPDLSSTEVPLATSTLQKTSAKEAKNNSEGITHTTPYNVHDSTVHDIVNATINVTNVKTTSTSFTINWTYSINESTSYVIKIENRGANHFVTEECKRDNQSIPEKSSNSTSYTFNNAYPDYNYTVEISTMKTTSKDITTITTNSSAPEKPQNFYLKKNLITPKKIEAVWSIPCKPNGAIKEYNFCWKWTQTDKKVLNDSCTIIPADLEKNKSKYTKYLPYLAGTIYEVKVNAINLDNINGTAVNKNITIPESNPFPPVLNEPKNVESNSFLISWNEPTPWTGIILNYNITITSHGPNYEFDEKCQKQGKTNYYYSTTNTFFNFENAYPYYSYSVSVSAATSKGNGNFSETKTVLTKSTAPSMTLIAGKNVSHKIVVSDWVNYTTKGNISFEKPCYLNGPLKHYILKIHGFRQNAEPQTKELKEINNDVFVLPSLKPQYLFYYNITVYNELFSTTSDNFIFSTKAGVPDFNKNLLYHYPVKVLSSSKALVKLDKTIFDTSNGDVQYIALILTDKNVTGGFYDLWNEIDWPFPISNDTNFYYQVTSPKWNPFTGINKAEFEIGNDRDCTIGESAYCNGPLERHKDYYLIIRIFTKDAFRNSGTFYFKSGGLSDLAITFIVLFTLCLLALLGVVYFLWKHEYIRIPEYFNKKLKASKARSKSLIVQVKKFRQYYKSIQNNSEILKEQYALLEQNAREVFNENTTIFATLPENRRKNRYSNILPYDKTRVKLNIDEDDEICSDYINASYIRGFSGGIEYIATQGPLQSTLKDFWKMILQENVSMIVMVSEFVEQNKEKCYKYFPKNHESMSVDDMEIKCSVELHFGTYCVRTLQVKKDTAQATITHMQFLDWPDFGVPVGTENMLQFCYQIRDRIEMDGGCIVVHCSAGVGRTGTLIATDILLQTIRARNSVNIFNTVLDLRRQRTHMVQREVQYVFIYSLINEYLENPYVNEASESEHVYENMHVLKSNSSEEDSTDKINVESRF